MDGVALSSISLIVMEVSAVMLLKGTGGQRRTLREEEEIRGGVEEGREERRLKAKCAWWSRGVGGGGGCLNSRNYKHLNVNHRHVAGMEGGWEVTYGEIG